MLKWLFDPRLPNLLKIEKKGSHRDEMVEANSRKANVDPRLRVGHLREHVAHQDQGHSLCAIKV
jgi:hypothetical protein